jgi:CBS domain-containing protein
MSATSQEERNRSTNEAEHRAYSMYRFLECRADQYMTRSVITVTPQVTLRDLKALFDKHDFNSFPVVDGGKMVGIVTKFDFLRAFVFTTSQMMPRYDDLMKRPVQQIMTECVSSIEPTTPLPRVLELMVSLKARSFPVVDAKGEVVGMISREDVRQALGEATQNAD